MLQNIQANVVAIADKQQNVSLKTLQNITNNTTNIAKNTTEINNVNVKVDGVKGDLDGLTKRVDKNEKDINVAGTIAIENRKFIGDNKKLLMN